MGLLSRLFYTGACVGVGWIIGSKYAAPPVILETTDRLVLTTKDKISKALEDVRSVDELAPEDIAKGDIPAVHVTKTDEKLYDTYLATSLKLCRTSISNAPSANSENIVMQYKPLVKVGGIDMAVMPVKNACLSSGYGRRKGKLHKGVDYFSKTGGAIFAAADGQIVEAEYRDDYGFTVLLNHGNGYFTRYAHLKEFSEGVKIGSAVPRGFKLGPMGQTAGYAIPKHLHFEVLKGDYDTPKKSFGLETVDIFDRL